MMWKILPFFVALFVVGLGLMPPGGTQDINPNDPDFQRAVRFAVSEYNRNSYEENIYKVERVIKSQSQVVAGMNYFMTLRLGKTFCKKDIRTEFCPFIRKPRHARFIICTFTVWDRPWLHAIKVTDSKCKEINPRD